jgi:diguanylate cyclase (GGDEF)-like protein
MGKDKARVLERWTWILVTVLTLASLGIIWTVFVTSTLGERLRTSNRETESLQRESRIFASGLGRILDDSRLALEVLVNHVEAHPKLNPLTDPEVLSLVRLFGNQNQDVADLRVADQSGQVSFIGTAEKTPVSIADRDYFRVQTPYPGVGFFIDRPVFSRVAQWWTLGLSLALPPNAGSLAMVYASLEFSRLDRLINSLNETRGEIIRIYRNDGILLYQYPLSAGFPHPDEPNPLAGIDVGRATSGLLEGTNLTAFQRTENLPVWVVVSRPQSALAGDWEWWVLAQLLWVSLLTLLILSSAVGLVLLLDRLRTIHRAQAELARIDPLTGLINRRAFLERCTLERSRVERQAGPLSLALLDLDNFKEVNDRFGHQAGDQALQEFAKALQKTMRSTDALSRTGGEEFAVLMPGTDGKAAREIAERIRTEVATIALPKGRLTTSIGVALWDGAETFEAWYRRADQALYRAKDAGRNRVESALPSP